MPRYQFKEGEEVAHRDQLDVKLRVGRILKEATTFPTGEFDEDGKPIRKQGTKMIGIECHWWVEKQLQTYKFHSTELVPFEMAKKGEEEVYKWLTNQQSIASRE